MESTLKGQLQLATTRGMQIAKFSSSPQQQLQKYEQKVHAKFDQEQRQWMIKRGILNNRVMGYEEHEVQMRKNESGWFVGILGNHPYYTRSKGKAATADKDTEVAIIDQRKNPKEEDSGAHGKVLILRKQLAEWNRDWVCGLPPSMFPTDNSDNPPNL
ncbi:hypothetical protein HAX54_037655 [Datura stramonium]|uniref:Uncharacterized protein n=1 Tax=Datura stramonium TaxID=4076 RepID=A0ABS8SHI7_DATST|nr:hypothetical protein [Datura stramonium]